jgi:hypothetical protein
MQFHGFVLGRFEGNKIAERWATVLPPAEGNFVECRPRTQVNGGTGGDSLIIQDPPR